jgi:hypothetical protein
MVRLTSQTILHSKKPFFSCSRTRSENLCCSVLQCRRQLYQTGHGCIEDKAFSLKPSQLVAVITLVHTWNFFGTSSAICRFHCMYRYKHRKQQFAPRKVCAFYYQRLMHRILSTMRVGVCNHLICARTNKKYLTACENRQREGRVNNLHLSMACTNIGYT